MKICLIGGNGYIGNRLFLHLASQPSYQITIVDSNEYVNNSLLEWNTVSFPHVKRIEARYQDLTDSFYREFEAVILLAGQGSVSNSKNMKSVLENNINNFAHLLSLLSSDQKFIYASSSSVYGKTDTFADEGSRFGDPYNFYDLSKQMIDKLAFLSAKCYFGLRFGTVNGYSPNFRNDLMINSMIYNATHTNRIYVANPEINRPILGMGDLCRAIELILLRGTIKEAGVYNLSSFNADVDTISKSVCEIMVQKGFPVRLEYGDNPEILNFKLQTKAYNFKIGSTKFMQTFGFDFSDTIPGIVEDIMSHWSLVKNFQNRLKDTVRAYKTVPGCLVCGATTVPLLDLHQQPLANKYHTELSIPESYPLRLDYCPECFHSQLSVAVNPDKFFKNYLYVSGTSKTLRDYFRKFARFSLERLQMLKETVGKQKSIRVLEIACNDGSLLDEYEALERKTGMGILRVGVDPAENIYQNITRKKNHHIYCEYFTQTTVDKLLSDFGSFDLIVAQNVIAHIDYPGLFLDLCKQLISPSHGVLFLQTSQKNMIRNGEFDTVYHEHLSFFSANSMEKLCSKKGMILNNITEDEIHGTSYVFEVLPAPLPAPSNTKAVIEEERKAGLYDPTTFTKYKHDALYYKNTFHNRLLDYRLRFRIIGYGSTAKSNTLLNFCGIGSDLIDWIVDDNLLKQGLYTPGSDIPICSTDSLRTIDTERTVLVVFAWNFFQEIKEKIIRIFRDEYGKSGTLRILNIHPLEEHAVSL